MARRSKLHEMGASPSSESNNTHLERKGGFLELNKYDSRRRSSQHLMSPCFSEQAHCRAKQEREKQNKEDF